ncbi:MAG: hypothetical protein ABJA75_22700 [Bradyrhizobium sp.]
MRAAVLFALALISAAPAWAAEVPSGCDKFKWPIERERAPKEGTFAGFASIKTAPKAGLYTVSLSTGGWVDVVQDSHFLKPKAFSGATDCDGIRKTMKYELSASPFVLQVSGTRDNSISIAVLPTE